jgi:hypothetical protein
MAVAVESPIAKEKITFAELTASLIRVAEGLPKDYEQRKNRT